MKTRTSNMLALAVAIVFVAMGPPAQAQITNVVATGIYPADVQAVQTAVDNGGTVILHGDFNFGTVSWSPVFQEAGSIVISKPNVTLMGLYHATITGGGKEYITPDGWDLLAVIFISAPGVRVVNLELKGSPDTGILLYAPSAPADGKCITIEGNTIAAGWTDVLAHAVQCPVKIVGNTMTVPTSDTYGNSFGILVPGTSGSVDIQLNHIVAIPSAYTWGIRVLSTPAQISILGNALEQCSSGIEATFNGGSGSNGSVEIAGNHLVASTVRAPDWRGQWYAEIASIFNGCPVTIKGNTDLVYLDHPGDQLAARHLGIWAFDWSASDPGGVDQSNPPVTICDNVVDMRYPVGDFAHQAIEIWLGATGAGLSNVSVLRNRLCGKAMVGIDRNEFGHKSLIMGNILSGLTSWETQIGVWARETAVIGNVLGPSNALPGYSEAVELSSRSEFGGTPAPLPIEKCILSQNDYRGTGLPGWGAGTSGCIHIFSAADKGGMGTEVRNNAVCEAGMFPKGTRVQQQVWLESSGLVHDNYVLGISPPFAHGPDVDLWCLGIRPGTGMQGWPVLAMRPMMTDLCARNVGHLKWGPGAVATTAPSTVQQERPFALPEKPMLYGNYPNPFNPSTTIQYDLPAPGFVVLKVYDGIGREVATLVNGDISAGTHTVRLDGTNLASGTYFYRLQAPHYVATRRMELLR